MTVLFKKPNEEVWGSINWTHIVRKSGERFRVFRLGARGKEILETDTGSLDEAARWVQAHPTPGIELEFLPRPTDMYPTPEKPTSI